jgi:excisionase family DNA binding protein
MPKKKYTVTEAAKYLHITRVAVHTAIKKKKLRAKWGKVTQRALLIDSKDLEAYEVDLTRQRSGKKKLIALYLSNI